MILCLDIGNTHIHCGVFEKQNLIGLVHSREVQINNTITHKLNCCYFVTFFDDYAKEEQMKFFEYMNEWIQGVD